VQEGIEIFIIILETTEPSDPMLGIRWLLTYDLKVQGRQPGLAAKSSNRHGGKIGPPGGLFENQKPRIGVPPARGIASWLLRGGFYFVKKGGMPKILKGLDVYAGGKEMALLRYVR
jgi:hypothetical protein